MSRIQHILSWLLCLAIASTLAACDGPPDVRETITYLKIMGIQAEPPAAKPGQEVKLKALAAIVPSATINYTWYACNDPANAADGCHLKGESIGTGDNASLSIPDGYLKDNKDPALALRGRYFFVTLVAKSGDDEAVATKRIVVQEKPENKNPALNDLKVFKSDGKTTQSAPFTAALEAKIRLTPDLKAGAAQRYEIIDPNGKKTQVSEQLFYSWYTTAGTYSKGYLSDAKAPENTWVVPKETPKNPKTTLFLIVRDGRGGIAWQRTEIEIK